MPIISVNMEETLKHQPASQNNIISVAEYCTLYMRKNYVDLNICVTNFNQ